MDLDTPVGHYVKYSGRRDGYFSNNAPNDLIAGVTYQVSHIEIDDWSSLVYLKGHESCGYNTVCFENVKQPNLTISDATLALMWDVFCPTTRDIISDASLSPASVRHVGDIRELVSSIREAQRYYELEQVESKAAGLAHIRAWDSVVEALTVFDGNIKS